MKPEIAIEMKEEIVEVHSSGRSPSPKHQKQGRSRSRSRKLSNGHHHATEETKDPDSTSEKSNKRDSWIKSEQNESVELPIHDQIKQGILGFVEKEFKNCDATGQPPSFVFYSHDPSGLDDKYMKSLSRPGSGYKEKRSPSYRRKKRHSSRHRERELQEFEIPGSSLSALERVDDYLKEYNKAETVTLSGDLEIEPNDAENNNQTSKDHHKHRKTRRKAREERLDASSSNGRDVSPKIFKSANKSKSSAKPARPTDLVAMLETLETRSYAEQYIDNPFSSPSPVTSPNDERLDPFGIRRPEKVYLQGGGTFQAVSRDRILADATRDKDEEKYFRLGVLTPLDIALLVQKAWRSCSPACHGVLGGLSLMHLLLISYSDSLDAGHLSFHAVVTTPYVAAYYFFCILCLVSVLDRLEPTCLDVSRGLQPYFQPIVLVILYTGCLLVCATAHTYDELMREQYPMAVANNFTHNATAPAIIPSFYYTWTHFSIWRAVLAILGLVYFVITNPQDLLYQNLTNLVQYRQTLQSIG